MDYSSEQQYNSAPIMRVGGGIKLPLPRKINDFTFQMWEEWSATAFAADAARTALSSAGISGGGNSFFSGFLGSAVTSGRNYLEQAAGVAVNPAMFMLYKRPAYKEYELSWLLAPSNKKESDDLKKIIDIMKYNSLPSLSGRIPFTDQVSSKLWDYPSTCLVTLTPDKYTFKFRPSVIVSVSADYHAAGGPSYFKSGAPTIVSLSLRLKELSFWTKDNFGPESSIGGM